MLITTSFSLIEQFAGWLLANGHELSAGQEAERDGRCGTHQRGLLL